MKRWRRWSVPVLSACLLMTVPALLRADEPQQKPGEKWLVDRSLTLTPADIPTPALKYRLFPLYPELKEGNAVPIYLRLMFERSEAWKKALDEQPTKWNAMPLDKLPVKEIEKFLGDYSQFLDQIELGARRKNADWNYTLDQKSIFSILLPDAQTMRRYVPILILNSRLKMAQGDFAGAAHAFETALAFSRQVANGPFIVNELVGLAMSQQILQALLDFAQAPHAPNLYWSIAALPRPLISMRHGLEFEQRTLYMEFFELNNLDRPRSPAQWAAILRNVRDKYQRFSEHDQGMPLWPGGTHPKDAAGLSPDLPTAKQYLTATVGIPAANVEAMPAAQVLVLWIVKQYQAYSDDVFKGVYLTFAEGRKVLRDSDRQFQDAPNTEAWRLAKLLLPAVFKVKRAEDRLNRQVAALRVIEAIRLYAAKHNGQLPEKLSDIQTVPVPVDPGTEKPFEYRKEGDTATLIGRMPGEPLELTGMRFRLRIHHS